MPPTYCRGVEKVRAAQDRWSAMSPAERAAAGPSVIAACGDALRELRDRLLDLQFPVRDVLHACPDLAAEMRRLELHGPPIPPPLRALWEEVGSVTFVEIPGYSHVQFWIDQGIQFMGRFGRIDVLPQFCDGVRVEAPCSAEWVDYQLDEFTLQREAGDILAYMIAPDGYHKDDISGGDPYELAPSEDDPWAPRLKWFEWAGPQRPTTVHEDPPCFVSYLRASILECGGFPGLYGSRDYEPLRRRLVDNLPVF